MQRHFFTVSYMKRYIGALEDQLCGSPTEIYDLHEQLVNEGIFFRYKPLNLDQLHTILYK